MMKRKRFVVMGILLLLSIGMAWSEDVQYIQVREASVRDKPSALGKVLASIPYTSEVSVLEKSGSWVKISSSKPKVQGWISASALSTKKLALKAGDSGSSSASSSEVALAGKGFNDQVEKEYRAQNGKLDYTWVDKMEKINVSDQELEQFLKIGPKGAAQ